MFEKNIAALRLHRRYIFKYYVIYTNLVLHIFPDKSHIKG